MRISEIDSKLFEKCWNGYKSHGTKKKGGKTVPDCRKNEGAIEEDLRAWFGKGNDDRRST